MYSRHEEFVGAIDSGAEELFEVLDDQMRLSSHMRARSWKMGWGKMEFVFDEAHGKAVGSHIGLHGRVFGLRLSLDEIVTDRVPPLRKAWETVGEPRLLVIGAYRMAYEITRKPAGVELRVSIYYDLPTGWLGRILGRLFGRAYAKWCTRQMVTDAARVFADRTKVERVEGAVR